MKVVTFFTGFKLFLLFMQGRFQQGTGTCRTEQSDLAAAARCTEGAPPGRIRVIRRREDLPELGIEPPQAA
ncbi:hypothetical protein KH017_11805 [bacterium]|nr:hypothetical protein [bacterium]